MKTKWYFFFFQVLLFNLPFNNTLSQNLFFQNVSTYVDLATDTLVLGEPQYFYYVMFNNSDKEVYVQNGGDYRGGMKHSFSVVITSIDGDTIPYLFDVGKMGGGLIGFDRIAPWGKKRFKLFLPNWGEIEKEGNYTIEVSKNFRLSPTQPKFIAAKNKTDISRVVVVPLKSIKNFIVVKDDVKLGEFIQNLTAEMKAESNSYYNKYEQRQLLRHVKDKRIIPFLEECRTTNKYLNLREVNRLLAQFED